MIISDKIPITVGIIGHLDVVTTEEHRQQISKLFTDLASGYPNSPIYLFSSIAEGADRFAANIFLELKRSDREYEKKFELIVPIPFNTSEYKKDFSDASKKEFDELLKSAKRSFCIDCDGQENDRPQQYLKAGKFVADSSLILIALWNGEKGGKGGTADIVHHKIAGNDENVAESTFEYDGTVFVLPCYRSGSPSSNTDEKNVLCLDQVLKDSAIKDTLEKIEEINSLSEFVEQTALDSSQSNLFNNSEKLDESQKLLMKWYSVCDTLSLVYRKRDVHITIWLFALGFLLILALQIYSNIDLSNLVLGLAMFFNVIAALIYIYSRTTKNHKKYLYHRTLAEALRIQFFWNFAGINKNVSDYILRIHKKDFTWVKYFLSAIYGITYSEHPISSEIIGEMKGSWVKNQADFFESSINNITKRLGFYQRISNISFVIGFVLLVSIFIFNDTYKAHNFLSYLLVIIGTFFSLFALIRAYIQIKSYEQLLNQYELMNVIYQRAESKINESETYQMDADRKNSYLKELFFVIGKEALIENGHWYLILKEKEPEPKGI